MASIETDLPRDIEEYAPKPIFGKFTTREFVCLVVVVVLEVPLVLHLVRGGIDALAQANKGLVALAAALPAMAVGVVGLSKREGLYFEQWFPAARAEAATARVIVPAVASLEGKAEPAAGRRQRRREARDLAAALDEAGRAEGLACAMAAAGRVMPGRPAGQGQEAPSTVAVGCLARSSLLPEGLSTKDVSRLARSGVACVAVEPDGELARTRGVGRRRARRAHSAAAAAARLLAWWPETTWVAAQDALAAVAKAESAGKGRRNGGRARGRRGVRANDDGGKNA